MWPLVKHNFNSIKKARAIIVTLARRVAEYLSHMLNRKPASSHIMISTLFHKRKMIQEYILQSTFNQYLKVVTNNSFKNNNNNANNVNITII